MRCFSSRRTRCARHRRGDRNRRGARARARRGRRRRRLPRQQARPRRHRRADRASSGGAPRCWSGDVRDAATAGRAGRSDGRASSGAIDILVNNAGTIRRAPAVDFSDDDWAAVLDVNLTGVFRLCRAAGRRMLPRGPRQDRQHRLAALVSGRHHRARLRRVQGRRRAADQGARQRVGGQGRQRQRDRARLHPHRQHRGARRRPGAQPPDHSSASRPGAGASRPTSAARPSSSRRARATTSAATSWSSTADGWDGE